MIASLVVLAIIAAVIWYGLRSASAKQGARAPTTPAEPIASSSPMRIEIELPTQPEPIAAAARLSDQKLIDRFQITAVDDAFLCRHYRFPTLMAAIRYARRLSGETLEPFAPPSVDPGVTALTHVGSGAGSDDPFTVALPTPATVQTSSGQVGRAEAIPAAAAYAGASENRSQKTVSSGSKTQDWKPRWYPSGTPVTVSNVTIASPMVYIGRQVSTWDAPRELINPHAQVGLTGTDPEGEETDYWPAYSRLSPGGRKTYLDWLAGGREGPIGIGYVFIFFYGLERRVFADRALGELDEIMAEVRRLAELHGPASPSFSLYARRFINAATLLTHVEVTKPEVSRDLRTGEFEISLAVRRYLGAKLVAREAFDADDCLIWLLSLPDLYLNTPGQRCFAEMTDLFRLRFNRRRPEGLRVRAPKRRVTATYHSASSDIRVDISVGDLPDIAAVSAPLAELRDLLWTCQGELDSFSRLLHRQPDARETLDGVLCLPQDLLDAGYGSKVAPVREALEAVAGDGQGVAAVKSLLDLLGLNLEPGKIPTARQRQIAGMLDRLGFAYEPDRRYSDAALTQDGTVVVYRGRTGGPATEVRPAFSAARTLVEVAMLAAAADGEVVTAEMDQIATDLDSLPDIEPDERDRLTAHALWLSQDPPRQQNALNRLTKLGEPARKAAARAALGAVLADGRVLPAEVRFLEKLHKVLGLPQDDVYAALHRGALKDDNAPRAAAPGPVSKANPGSGPSSDVSLDTGRLARLREETAQVSSLLTSIFTEAEPEPVAALAPPAPAAPSRFQGLDDRHAELLARLLHANVLDRGDFDALARSLKLLPDGAIETINDWGFDTFDEPVLEDGDDVAVASHLTDRLNAVETAA